jgi:hypothetical protein
MLTRKQPMRRSALRRDTGEARLTVKAPRKRKCAICKEPATSAMNLKPFCSPGCGLELAKLTLAKQERARDREAKKRMRTAKQWMPIAQTAFNAYIRLRDAGKPCICCGQPFQPQTHGGSVDAGHYLSRGSAPHLRFNEDNVHAQRKNCNMPGGTTRNAFRAGMVERIGLDRVLALEADQSVKKYTAADLEALTAEYRAKARALKGAR